MFRTLYSKRDPVYSPTGTRIKKVYKPRFEEDGSFILEAAGVIDIYSEIQSYADSVDIHSILKRFAAGDLSVLQRIQGTYGDFTNLPKTYAEVLQCVSDATNYFKSLPAEVRGAFNNSPDQFIASIGTDRFNQILSLVSRKDNTVTTKNIEQVKTDVKEVVE